MKTKILSLSDLPLLLICVTTPALAWNTAAMAQLKPVPAKQPAANGGPLAQAPANQTQAPGGAPAPTNGNVTVEKPPVSAAPAATPGAPADAKVAKTDTPAKTDVPKAPDLSGAMPNDGSDMTKAPDSKANPAPTTPDPSANANAGAGSDYINGAIKPYHYKCYSALKQLFGGACDKLSADFACKDVGAINVYAYLADGGKALCLHGNQTNDGSTKAYKLPDGADLSNVVVRNEFDGSASFPVLKLNLSSSAFSIAKINSSLSLKPEYSNAISSNADTASCEGEIGHKLLADFAKLPELSDAQLERRRNDANGNSIAGTAIVACQQVPELKDSVATLIKWYQSTRGAASASDLSFPPDSSAGVTPPPSAGKGAVVNKADELQ